MSNTEIKKEKNLIRILLVGAGNLGSRYLEGLLKLDAPLEIDIIEPSKKATENCKRLLKNLNLKNKKLNFKNSFSTNKNSYEIALVATTADVREEVISTINNYYSINFCILEKILTQSINSLEKIKKSVDNFEKTWVNNCMRVMQWHLKMKEIIFLNNKNSVQAVINGQGWGMACNAIHYIDLIGWWTNSKLIKIDTSQIKCWQPSKRLGFYECFGKIRVFFEKENYLELNCDFGKSDLIMQINTPKSSWELNETEGIASDTNSQKIFGELEYQSNITCPVVENILQNGDCGLTSFNESYFEHKHLLVGLLKSWNKLEKNKDNFIPIT